MDGALVRYDTMCRAIDAAYDIDEVKDIRDKATAFEAYAKQAKNTEAERRACEIRLRAERRAGQLLRDMEKAKGGNPNLSNGTTGCHDTPPTLNDLGISRDQSSKWQKLADVPEDDFEAAMAGPDKPTTGGIIKPEKPGMDPQALWLWGRLRDFERGGLINRDQTEVVSEMTEAMRADCRRLIPAITTWLNGAFDE